MPPSLHFNACLFERVDDACEFHPHTAYKKPRTAIPAPTAIIGTAVAATPEEEDEPVDCAPAVPEAEPEAEPVPVALPEVTVAMEPVEPPVIELTAALPLESAAPSELAWAESELPAAPVAVAASEEREATTEDASAKPLETAPLLLTSA